MPGNGQAALSPEAQLREDQRREALRREQEAAHLETQHEQPRQESYAAVEAPPPPAPRVEQRVEEPRVEVPRVDPKVLLESAGLVMIETDRSKAPPIAPAGEEPQHLGRPRRERARSEPQEEELVQIETTRKQAS
jgi:hypothetical protein